MSSFQFFFQFGAAAQFAVDEADDVHFSSCGQFHVGQTVDVLVEDVADAFLSDVEAGEEFVAAAEWCLVVDGDACHYGDDVLLAHFGETDACLEQKLMPCVFHVVLVVGVVDDAFHVAFVVADLHLQLVCVVLHLL